MSLHTSHLLRLVDGLPAMENKLQEARAACVPDVEETLIYVISSIGDLMKQTSFLHFSVKI